MLTYDPAKSHVFIFCRSVRDGINFYVIYDVISYPLNSGLQFMMFDQYFLPQWQMIYKGIPIARNLLRERYNRWCLWNMQLPIGHLIDQKRNQVDHRRELNFPLVQSNVCSKLNTENIILIVWCSATVIVYIHSILFWYYKRKRIIVELK